MDIETFDEYKNSDTPPGQTMIMVAGPDRTLAYGYTCERDTFHVYLLDGVIHRLIAKRDGRVLDVEWYDGRTAPCEALRPDKRVYPQYTDATFAVQMRALGFPLPFTTWSEPKHDPFEDRRHDNYQWV